MDELRQLPSVDRLLRHPVLVQANGDLPRPVLVRAIREVLDEARRRVQTRPGSYFRRHWRDSQDSHGRSSTGRRGLRRDRSP